jgi:ribosomal protein S18 acetylase RimI-like enzyme
VTDPAPGLRAATHSDIPELLRLETASFAGDRVSARSFRRWLAHKGALVLVIEDEGQPGNLSGYALVLWHVHGRVARLYSLAVDPAARGRGIGARLLDACAERARERGCEEFRLEVAEANEPALALYRRAGFGPFARRRAYYADGSDALRLRRRL